MRDWTASTLLGVVLLLGLIPASGADPRCQNIDDNVNFGPYDYRDKSAANRPRINIVEKHHYTKYHRQAALNGQTEPLQDVLGNMTYTLRALPNHPGALYHLAVWELSLRRYSKDIIPRLESLSGYAPVSCYFERAARFAPDDPNVYNAWGRVLHRAGKPVEAATMFEKVVQLAPKSAAAHYNLGLAYFAIQQYEKSAGAARRAYELGYPRTELRQRLLHKGFWK